MTEPDVKTLADLPFHVSGRFPKPVLLQRCRADGTDDLSSRELFDRVRDFSLGLSDFGIRPGDRVALVSESRPEWTIADLAILTAGAVTVPVYPTLTAGQMQGILADSGARLVIVSDAAQAAKLRSVRRTLSAIEAVVVIDAADDGGADGTAGELPLSAAVIPNFTVARLENGQDWVQWVHRGDVDFVVPMAYTYEPADLARQVKLIRRTIGDNHFLIGLPVFDGRTQYLGYSVSLLRQQQILGYALFSYNALAEEEFTLEFLERVFLQSFQPPPE